MADEQIMNKLSNWIVEKRMDSEDKIKHMGILLLSSRYSKNDDLIFSCEYKEGYRYIKSSVFLH